MLLFIITIIHFYKLLSRCSAFQQIFDWVSRDTNRELEGSKFFTSSNLYISVLGGPRKALISPAKKEDLGFIGSRGRVLLKGFHRLPYSISLRKASWQQPGRRGSDMKQKGSLKTRTGHLYICCCDSSNQLWDLFCWHNLSGHQNLNFEIVMSNKLLQQNLNKNVTFSSVGWSPGIPCSRSG